MIKDLFKFIAVRRTVEWWQNLIKIKLDEIVKEAVQDCKLGF